MEHSVGAHSGDLWSKIVPSLASITENLARAETQFLAAADAVPPGQWKTCPGQGRWSAGELVCHLIMVERAIIKNAPILILDEPTAALDTESEKLVIDALEQLMKGRTVITIAHRLSTIRDAHKILVLKDGVVFEEGSHDELVARGGFYAELYRVQIEGTAAHAHN